MAVATIRIPGLNYRPRNPTLVRYRSSAGSSSQTSFLRTFFPGNHRFERRRQFELPREKRRLVLVDAKISKADDAARDRRNLQKRHDGWRGESAKKKSSTASTTASASSPPKEVPADSSPPAVVSSPADSGTSEPAATVSVTAAAPEPADTSVPDTVPANASGTETALATEPDASTAAAAAAAADTATDTATAAEPVLIAPPEDVPPSEAALPRTAIATESPFPALSAAAQESLSRAQRASSGAWQSLATAAAEPVTLPKQLQESVQALPLPPSLTRRLGVADGSAVLLTRGQLAAALLAVGLLVKGIQSWLKARATALNNEYAVPAPLLPASPNFPTIPDLPPVVPTKRTPEELPNLPVSSPPRQLPERAIAPVPVPVMASAAESREEEKTLLPPAFFKFTDSLPPLPFPFKNWSSFGKASGVSPIDMDEIDRMAAAAASKGDVSDSEIDDRPRLIKLQQDNAMAWFALITGFLVLVAYAWNPANPATACIFLLLLYCSPATAFGPISRQLISNLHAARRVRGVSARTVPPPAARLVAARRAEKSSTEKELPAEKAFSAERAEEASAGGGTSGGTSFPYSMSTSLGLRVSAVSPQASAANTAALKAIFAAALLPIPANKPNACAWPGVTCAANGAVVGLNLTSTVSRLLLPPTPRLCNRTARVPGGKFPATLSESIGQLTDLVQLYLPNLWLAGAVPRSLSRLTKLDTLDLQDNCFAGPLPVAFFRLPNLYSLTASRNFFSSGLPQRAASYASMTSLAILDLGINWLSGPIPAALATLPSLGGLLLNTNRLSGKIPPALLKRESFSLVLDGNRLSGDLSGQQIKATLIGMSQNRLTGNFNTIQLTDSLTFIDVSQNLFSGSFPRILCRSGSLESADFSRNRLTGTVPANCFKTANPMQLAIFLSHNNFSGSLQPFSNLPSSIAAVDLGFNRFTGGIPRGLTTLPQLNYLDLGGNSLTGPIPAFCQGKQQLTYLNLASNALSGPPTPLSSQSCSASLALLYLSSNRLSGPIPATISSFTRLKRLLLDKNALTGAIPAGVSKMQRLQGLGLSYNRLTGKIPAVWPAAVRTLLLAGNRLSGAVPAALSKLKRGSFKPGNPNLCGKPLPACA
ncbi:unnamed protein product [Closterium sp. Yama58-4]|nr:unnamed protein product [Closterium sp. Yama58-4]